MVRSVPLFSSAVLLTALAVGCDPAPSDRSPTAIPEVEARTQAEADAVWKELEASVPLLHAGLEDWELGAHAEGIAAVEGAIAARDPRALVEYAVIARLAIVPDLEALKTALAEQKAAFGQIRKPERGTDPRAKLHALRQLQMKLGVINLEMARYNTLATFHRGAAQVVLDGPLPLRKPAFEGMVSAHAAAPEHAQQLIGDMRLNASREADEELMRYKFAALTRLEPEGAGGE